MKSRSRRIVALIIAVSFVCIAVPAIAQPPIEPEEGKMWKAVFADDFDGNSLDRGKWDPYYNWGGDSKDYDHNYDGCVKEDYSIVEDGKLKLKCDKSSNNCGKTYSVGVVNSKFKFTYGYIEGSLMMPEGYSNSGNGLWPAFWTLHGKNWPSTGEIDILEYFGTNDQWAYRIHYSGGNKGGKHKISDATSKFHKYAAYWQPGKTDFYLDEEYVATVNHPDFNNTHYIAINFGIGGHSWLGNPSGNNGNMPLYYQTDFVRVWQQVDDDGSTGIQKETSAPKRFDIAVNQEPGKSPAIAFTLSEKQAVTLELYDALGNLVTSSRDLYASGRHLISLESIAKGRAGNSVYFCKLSGNNFNAFRRVVFAN